MKPSKLASGVRNSWLALATKSARVRSIAASRLRSINRINSRPPLASGGSSGTTRAETSRGKGTGRWSSTVAECPSASASSMAAANTGWRSSAAASGPCPPASGPSMSRAAGLARSTARSAESNSTGSGRFSRMAASARRSLSICAPCSAMPRAKRRMPSANSSADGSGGSCARAGAA